MSISPEVQAIAEAQAAKDRDLLASLVKRGLVHRGRTGNENPTFVADIQRRVGLQAHAGINLALKPNKKKAKKRGR